MTNIQKSIFLVTIGSLLIALTLTGGLIDYYSRDTGVDVPRTFKMKFYPVEEEEKIWNTSPFTHYLSSPSLSDSSSEQSLPVAPVISTTTTTLPFTTTTTQFIPSPTTTTTMTPTTVNYASPLSKAVAEIGSLEGEDDYSVGGFWCYRFVAWAHGWQELVAEASWADLSQRLVAVQPSEARAGEPPLGGPTAGDVVAINLMPEHSAPDQVSHTGLVESIDEDGRMITIEGNTLNEEGVSSVNRVERRVDDQDVVGIYGVIL